MKETYEIFIPIKNKKFVLDGRGKLRIYTSIEDVKKYLQSNEYDEIQKYVREDMLELKVDFNINPLDRLVAIRDYLMFLDEKGWNADHVCSYLAYENFLKTGGK